VKIKKIRKIIRIFEQSTVEQLEITVKKVKIKMQKPTHPTVFTDSQNSSSQSDVPFKSSMDPFTVGWDFLH
jgi:hypothetical protein